MSAIAKDSPIDHRRRRDTLISQCSTWLHDNGLSVSRAVYLANFIEQNAKRWAEDLARPPV